MTKLNESLKTESDVLMRFHQSDDKLAIVHLLTQIESIFGIKKEKYWSDKKKREIFGLSLYKKLLSWKFLLCFFSFIFFQVFVSTVHFFAEGELLEKIYMSVVLFSTSMCVLISSFHKNLSIYIKRLFIPVSNNFIECLENEIITDKSPLQFMLFLKNMGIREDLSILKQRSAVENFMSWVLSLFIVVDDTVGIKDVENFLSKYAKNDNVTEEFVWLNVLLIVRRLQFLGLNMSCNDLIGMGIDFKVNEAPVSLEPNEIKLRALTAFINMEKNNGI